MRWLVGSCQVLLATLLSLPGCGRNGDDPGKASRPQLTGAWGPPLNRPAPEIAGEDTEGKDLRLSDHRGKVVLLSFWAHF